LCPHHRVSGGKVLSRGTKPCANRVATAWRLAASRLHRRQSALGTFFRRRKARVGRAKAITATTTTPATTSARLHGETSSQCNSPQQALCRTY
ncbi:MAG: hypothetical protein ACREOH_24595, partial [Candidatus Entotheonellia bacterium]